jgi:CubicO group peptidase (beta-lactamase class C family)
MRTRPLAILAAVVAGTMQLSAQPPTSAPPVVRGELGATIDTFLTRAAAHGLSGAILVARDGDVILRKGYGAADRERGVDVTAETPFFIGSLAKQFTAAAILRLEADGRLTLADTLGAFFPDAPADKRAITVRHLLSHTSGLPYLPSAGLFGRGSRDSVMREMLAEALAFPPGSRYEYSTPGYILLAGVIERASGMTYERYMRSLFERARLTSTGFLGERERWSAVPVRSYSDDAAERALADVPSLPRFVGAGSIVSTVGDLYRWYDALADGDILPNAQRDTLFAPVVRLGPNLQEALTWMLVSLPSGTLRQAAGDIGGFNAELRHYVDEHLVVIFASNARVHGRGYRELVMNYVARMSRGERVPFPPAVAAVTSSDLATYPGTYALADSGTVEIWASGDSLLIGATDRAGITMLAGNDSSQARRAAMVDERARRFLSALDNDTLAQAFMHASIPEDARRAYLGKIREVLGDSVQSLASVIGTAVDSPTGARSYVRLRHDGDEVVVSLVWSGGMLVGLEPVGHAAYTLRLRGERDGELTSFDLFTGHLVRVSLVADRELVIEAKGMTHRARR